MRRVKVGYLELGVYPLRFTNLGLWTANFLGAQSLWLADHYMAFVPSHVWSPEITPAAKMVPSPDGFFDPLPLLALAARRFKRVDIGTGVTEALRRHPMSLAQSFVTLDHISKGRAILGIGNGERCNVEPYGLPWGKQVSRLEEALTIIRLLWESQGRPVSYDGRFWKLKDAIFDLQLYDGRPPRIWVAAHAPRMLGLAGRLADGWLPFQKVTAEEYARRLGVIREAAAAAGRSMESFVPAQLLYPLMIGKSREYLLELVIKSRFGAALALMAPGELWSAHGLIHPLGEKHTGSYELVPTEVTPEHIDQALARMTPELLLSFMHMGSPSQIRDEIAPLVDAGARHIVVTNSAAAFTGPGPADLWRLGSLMRELKQL